MDNTAAGRDASTVLRMASIVGGRPLGLRILGQFTRWQSMNWDYAGKLQKAQMDLVDLPADLDFRLPR